MKGAPDEVVRNASDVARTVLSGGGTIAWFGGRIEEFDGVVASLNAQLLREPREKRAETKATLQPRYASALESLERDGRTVRTRLEKPLDRSTVTALYAAGALPSYVGNVFPKIDFSKVKLEALPYDLAGMSDQALADHLLKNPELAYLLPVVPVAAKKIIGKELAERARTFDPKSSMDDEAGRPAYRELATLFETLGTDDVVATTFLTTLGPRDFLQLSGRVALVAGADPDQETFSKENARLIERFQDALAGTLAAGTQRPEAPYPGARVVDQSDHYVSGAWIGELTRQGRIRTPVFEPDGTASGEVYGYQLLGPLLDHPNSNAAFLNWVGGDMIRFERDHAADHSGTLPWQRTSVTQADYRLDYRSGSEDSVPIGNDPVGGLMKALSTNADAARDFFTGERSDGRLTRVDYLLTDRHWAGDGVHDPGGLNPEHTRDPNPSGIGYLGDALKAATLNDPDQRSVQIVESIVAETYSEFAGEEKKSFSGKDFIDPALREDLSRIAGRYMPSLFVSFRGDEVAFVDTSDGRAFDDARIPEEQARMFLAELGKDPTAREHLVVSSNAYLVAQVNQDLHGVTVPRDVGDRIKETIDVSTDVRSSLDYGGGRAAAEETRASDAEHNKKVDTAFGLVKGLLGQASGKVPVAGAVFDQIMTEVSKGLQQESNGAVNQQVSEIFRGGADAQERLIRGVIWQHIPPGEGPAGVPPGADITTLTAEQQEAYSRWLADKKEPWAVALTNGGVDAKDAYENGHDVVKKYLEPESTP
ncbi:hypothetical protein KV097_04585 [Mumia sp. zg.B17]|uniref:hypothetical protein n=1 Tax=Mumia sp. zg.B17 TaxID=2855446 RepID=UPI001C6F59DB|nr:hypothetical protein [Mumia sp. zg.B17]MBW9205211.1 hypothetical protein [Mumia sp. zg.B17]